MFQLQVGGGFDYSTLITAWIWPLLAAVIGGVISGFIVFALIRHLQRPNLVASIRKDEYDGKAQAHYVHLCVQNRKTIWHRLLGGEAAVNCRCVLSVEGVGSFVPKWASREPWGTKTVLDHEGNPKQVAVIDPEHLEQAKLEVIKPGEEPKVVDVAVRMRGDSSCYIHTPENFKHPTYRPPDKELKPGTYRATAVFEYNGYATGGFHFRIANGAGDQPGLLSLEEE